MKLIDSLKYKLFYSLVISFLISSTALSQTLKVENVKFVEKGDKIAITYDFQGNPKKKYNVSLVLSYDFGSTYTMKPSALTGDIGNGIRPGLNKKIEWDMLKDYPDGLSGEGFVFAVRAERLVKKKWLPYALSGTGVVGGLIWFYYQSQPKNKKISILTITIPADI